MNSQRFGAKKVFHDGLKKAAPLFGAALGMFLFCFSTLSQGNAGRILGSITDQSGGAVAGAVVSVTDVQRGVPRSLIANESGEYNAPNLLPGTYSIRAEFKGFKTVERQNIVLETGQDIRVDLQLPPGEMTQTVTVTEALPLVETTNAELGGTIQSQIIDNLPMNGRNFENLLVLRPGVTIYPGGGLWSQSTNGMRPHDNVYLVNGVNSNDPWMGQSVMNGGASQGDSGTMLPVDAIDEFKTEENPRAEYGWKPGAVINVGIKSGTNSFHGTAYAYGRDHAWDARNYFNPPPNPVTPLGLEQFGATFGGPVLKNKLFFFLNYEDQRYTVGTGRIVEAPVTSGPNASVYSNGGVVGLIGACNAALANGGLTALSAQMAGLSFTADPGKATATNPAVNCKPLANYPGLFPVNDGNNSLGPNWFVPGFSDNNQIDAGLAKIDYHLSDHHSISGSYFISPGNGLFHGANPVSQLGLLQHLRAQDFAGNWTWTPNSTWVNEVRVGYAHYYQTFFSPDHTDDPANYSYNGSTYHIYTGQTDPINFGFPGLSFNNQTNLAKFGMSGGFVKIVGPDSQLTILDHISYLRGKHAFKFGGDFVENRSDTFVTANTKGPVRFDNLQTFFTGVPNLAQILVGQFARHLSTNWYAGFVQDDWHIKTRLIVNLGVRYELGTVQKERHNLMGNFDPSSPTGLVQVGLQTAHPYHGDHNNFSPRLGLAWDIFGNGKTVLRAGASILYEQLTYDVFQGVGNTLGLRTVPTGANLYDASGNKLASPGTIIVQNTTFNGAGLTGNAPGDIAFQWANNGPNTPLYSAAVPTCGTGNAVPGLVFTPQPCNVLGVDPNVRTPYVSNWNLDIQRAITSNLSLSVAYVGNHGTKLIGITDRNQQAPATYQNVANGVGTVTVGAGYTPAILALCAATPTKTNCRPNSTLEQNARPFNSKFPYLSYIDWMSNNDISNYDALQAVLTQRTSHGLSFTAGYTYSHALADASDSFGTGLKVPIDSTKTHQLLYTNTDFDIRQRFTLSGNYALPGRKSPLQLLEGWAINAVATIQTGTPWGVIDTTTDFSGTGEFNNPATSMGEQWDFFGNPKDFLSVHGLTPGADNPVGGIPYFAGTSNAGCLAKSTAMGPLAVASLTNLGCFAKGGSLLVPPPYGTTGSMGRGIFRDHGYRNLDMSVMKAFKFKERLSAQFRAEFFNVLNHPDFTNPFGGPGGGNGNVNPSLGPTFGYIAATPDVQTANPVLGAGGSRAIQLGLKLTY
jgi:hypothetical protein